jgi:hypothetical protein
MPRAKPPRRFCSTPQNHGKYLGDPKIETKMGKIEIQKGMTKPRDPYILSN